MLDTHAIARSLTAADFTPAQADALTDALREATEEGNHVTSDQFKAGQVEIRAEIAGLRAEQRTHIAEVRREIADVRTEIANLDTRLSTQTAGVRTEIASLETRLIRWMVGTVLATAALTVGIRGSVECGNAPTTARGPVPRRPPTLHRLDGGPAPSQGAHGALAPQRARGASGTPREAYGPDSGAGERRQRAHGNRRRRFRPSGVIPPSSAPGGSATATTTAPPATAAPGWASAPRGWPPACSCC